MGRSAIRAVLSISLLVITQIAAAVPLAAPATAAPNVTIVAGTGQHGFSGDAGPATSAKLALPRGIAADPAGQLFVIDSANKRLRQVDPTGTISTLFGDGGNCGAIDPVTRVKARGMCGIAGLTLDGDGALYYPEGGGITRTTQSGQATHFAGWYGFGPGPYGDGAKYDVRIVPEAVAYDATTGNLYFTESRSIRKVTPAGQVVTVAGRYNASSNAAPCNTGSADVAPAATSCFFPRGLAVHNGVVYFTESSQWNGPRVRRIDSDAVRTVAGNGTRLEPVVGGPAIASGFPELAGIALDPAGNMYASGPTRGRIWKVAAADNMLSLVTEFAGGVSWLTTDTTGNLYASLDFTSQIAKISGLQPPKPLPKISSIVPDSPVMTDPLLTRGVTIVPSEVSPPADYYEYGWANAQTATEPNTPLQRSDTTHGRLRYHDASPHTDWWLMGRGVNEAGEPGPWSTPHLVHTPKAPSLIVLGDSISSGHHNDYGDDHITDCDDATYGYAFHYSVKWHDQLPEQWQDSQGYVNLARSGFATQKRTGSGIDGSVLEGGENACHSQIEGLPPIELAMARLEAGVGSWNQVITSAGINDTNWGKAVEGVIQIQLADNFAREFMKHVFELPDVVAGPFKEWACGSMIDRSWNGRDQKVKDSISIGVRAIVDRLHNADPVAKLTWMGYYNTAGTGTNEGRKTPMFPASCNQAVDAALAVLHDTIKLGLGDGVQFIVTDSVMRSDNSKMQPLYVVRAATAGRDDTNPPGWPHPNNEGAKAIAGLLP